MKLKGSSKKFLSFKKWEFADIIVISNEAADAAKDDDEEEDEAWRSKSAGENDSLSMSFDGTILVNFLLLLWLVFPTLFIIANFPYFTHLSGKIRLHIAWNSHSW